MKISRSAGRAPTVVLLIFVLFLGTLSCGPAPTMIGEWPMFDPDWVVEVQIEIDENDWDELKVQQRSFMDVLCAETPPPNPFTYYSATVTIDGHRLENVGVRKKCFFGSCNDVRPALKVSFNEYVRGRRFYGMRRLTLNNNLSDPSSIKQCLGYWLFRKAGVLASRCNFAHVTVNGVDKGIYSHIESIKTELISRYFEDNTGNLYEGALSDFQPDWVGTYQKKTNQENPYRGDLDAMVDAMEAPDDQLVEALDPLMDLDAFYTFWAMEVSMDHVDGYCSRNHNNTYIYNDPATGRFHFIPWGIDGILWDRGLDPNNPYPRSVFADAILPHRLYQIPEARALYVDRLKYVLDTVWVEDQVLDEIDRMENLISAYTEPNLVGDIALHVEGVRQFARTYPDLIRAELEPEPPPWDFELPGPPCFSFLGSMQVSFSTTWGTMASLETDPFGVGTGTLEVSFHEEDQPPGDPIPTIIVGSAAGPDPNPESAGNPMVQVHAFVPGDPDDTIIVVAVSINKPELVASGATLQLDMADAIGVMYRPDPDRPDKIEFMLVLNGELKFELAGMTPGAPITGTFNGEIRESGW